MRKALVIENHPNDSRVKIRDDGICQALTTRMGTGGGNVPIVLEIDEEIYSNRNSCTRLQMEDK